MEKIYVLQCENDTYYVGKTSNIDRRFGEHLDGNKGSEWTRYYRPQQIIEVQDMINEYHEMNKTLEYMKMYGVDHVRGAQWSNLNLTSAQQAQISSLINPDGCFHCGKTGHFANNCTNRNRSSQGSPTVQCYTCGDHGHYANECHNNRNAVMHCERCGNNSHIVDDCYFTYGIDGKMLDCARCGRESHSAKQCDAKTNITGRRLD